MKNDNKWIRTIFGQAGRNGYIMKVKPGLYVAYPYASLESLGEFDLAKDAKHAVNALAQDPIEVVE